MPRATFLLWESYEKGILGPVFIYYLKKQSKLFGDVTINSYFCNQIQLQ